MDRSYTEGVHKYVEWSKKIYGEEKNQEKNRAKNERTVSRNYQKQWRTYEEDKGGTCLPSTSEF